MTSAVLMPRVKRGMRWEGAYRMDRTSKCLNSTSLSTSWNDD